MEDQGLDRERDRGKVGDQGLDREIEVRWETKG